MNDSKPRVAFFGLGLMGGGMAHRIVGAGFPLTVFNRNASKAAPLATAGARVAATPAAAAAGADILISMVADDVASRGVWLGEHGALAATAPGAVLVECSTLTLGWIRELAAAASARGCELIDAPVTGSKAQAASGELSFLAGGSAAAIEKAGPVLAVMSKAIIPLGPTGHGAVMKLVNNFMCGVQAVALAEAIAFIEHAGLDRDRAMEILTNGAPGSPLVKTFSARMTTPDYTPHFHLHLMAKDLAYAAEEARQAGVELRTARAALEVFRSAVAAGDGDKDVSAVVAQFRKAPSQP